MIFVVYVLITNFSSYIFAICASWLQSVTFTIHSNISETIKIFNQ